MSRDGTLPPGVEHWNIEEAQEDWEGAECYQCGRFVPEALVRRLPALAAYWLEPTREPFCPDCAGEPKP